MKELVISDNFTIEDIHIIREYNYERRKNMTFEERKADIENGARPFLEEIEKIRKNKALASQISNV